MKYYIGLFILLLFIGCISNKCYTVYQIDNGEDYIQDGMRRIVDRRGRIGYIDEKGAIIIKPQFAFGFPFKDGRAKVTNKGEKKVVPNSKGEYHYWESDKWFYITRVRDNILKSKEQKNIQPTKGGHKMVTCQNYVSLFYRQITSCPSDGGIS